MPNYTESNTTTPAASLSRRLKFKPSLGSAKQALRETGQFAASLPGAAIKSLDPRQIYKNIQGVVNPVAGEQGLAAQPMVQESNQRAAELAGTIGSLVKSGKLSVEKAAKMLDRIPGLEAAGSESVLMAFVNGASAGAGAASLGGMVSGGLEAAGRMVPSVGQNPTVQALTQPRSLSGLLTGAGKPGIQGGMKERFATPEERARASFSPEDMDEINAAAQRQSRFQRLPWDGEEFKIDIEDGVVRYADSGTVVAIRRGGRWISSDPSAVNNPSLLKYLNSGSADDVMRVRANPGRYDTSGGQGAYIRDGYPRPDGSIQGPPGGPARTPRMQALDAQEDALLAGGDDGVSAGSWSGGRTTPPDRMRFMVEDTYGKTHDPSELVKGADDLYHVPRGPGAAASGELNESRKMVLERLRASVDDLDALGERGMANTLKRRINDLEMLDEVNGKLAHGAERERILGAVAKAKSSGRSAARKFADSIDAMDGFTRKPTTWADVDSILETPGVSQGLKAPDGIPRYTMKDLGIRSPMDKFSRPPAGDVFMLETPSGTMLVDTQGYDYVRYAAKLPADRALAAPGFPKAMGAAAGRKAPTPAEFDAATTWPQTKKLYDRLPFDQLKREFASVMGYKPEGMTRADMMADLADTLKDMGTEAADFPAQRVTNVAKAPAVKIDLDKAGDRGLAALDSAVQRAHLAVASKLKLDITNLGWGQGDGILESKSLTGVLETHLRGSELVTKYGGRVFKTPLSKALIKLLTSGK